MGVVLRCYGINPGNPGARPCGWVGDSGQARKAPSGEERCPVCDGSTLPPLRFTLGDYGAREEADGTIVEADTGALIVPSRED